MIIPATLIRINKEIAYGNSNQHFIITTRREEIQKGDTFWVEGHLIPHRCLGVSDCGVKLILADNNLEYLEERSAKIIMTNHPFTMYAPLTINDMKMGFLDINMVKRAFEPFEKWILEKFDEASINFIQEGDGLIVVKEVLFRDVETKFNLQVK